MRVTGKKEREELIKQTVKMNKILIFSFTIKLQCDFTHELHHIKPTVHFTFCLRTFSNILSNRLSISFKYYFFIHYLLFF